MTTHTPATAEIEKWLRIRVRFFPNFWLLVRIRVQKKNAESCQSRLRTVLLPASISLSWWMTMKSFIYRISCVNVADLESSEEFWLEKVTKVKLARRFQCMRG